MLSVQFGKSIMVYEDSILSYIVLRDTLPSARFARDLERMDYFKSQYRIP